jgi:peptidylprolyl isomerase
MRIGEVADFVLQPDYAYGDKGSLPKIPPNAILNLCVLFCLFFDTCADFSNVELLSFEKEPTSSKEKISFGNNQKLKGNAFVQKQEWDRALKCYERGLAYTQYLFTKSEDLKKKKLEVVIPLFLNKAYVCLKMSKYADVFLACEEVLRIDSGCGKAYYRRALCYEMKGEWKNAKRDLINAGRCNPNDKEIRNELEKVNLEIQKEETKEREIYSSLFEKLKK